MPWRNILDNQSIVTFGVYKGKGKRWCDLPDAYVIWMVGKVETEPNGWLAARWAETIVEEAETRGLVPENGGLTSPQQVRKVMGGAHTSDGSSLSEHDVDKICDTSTDPFEVEAANVEDWGQDLAGKGNVCVGMGRADGLPVEDEEDSLIPPPRAEAVEDIHPKTPVVVGEIIIDQGVLNLLSKLMWAEFGARGRKELGFLSWVADYAREALAYGKEGTSKEIILYDGKFFTFKKSHAGREFIRTGLTTKHLLKVFPLIDGDPQGKSTTWLMEKWRESTKVDIGSW